MRAWPMFMMSRSSHELRVGVHLQAALGQPGLVLVRPADIDLLRHIALGAHAPVPDDHRQRSACRRRPAPAADSPRTSRPFGSRRPAGRTAPGRSSAARPGAARSARSACRAAWPPAPDSRASMATPQPPSGALLDDRLLALMGDLDLARRPPASAPGRGTSAPPVTDAGLLRRLRSRCRNTSRREREHAQHHSEQARPSRGLIAGPSRAGAVARCPSRSPAPSAAPAPARW